MDVDLSNIELFNDLAQIAEETMKNNIKQSILECALEPSQLSSSPTEISKDLYKNENYMDAISRSVQDLRDWVNQTDTLDVKNKNNLEKLLDRADEIYTPIKAAIKSELKIA